MSVAGVAEQAPVGELIDAAVTPGIAAHDPPYGEDRPPDHTELSHGLHGVARTARVITAAGAQIGGDQPAVCVHGQQKGLAKQVRQGGQRAFHVLRRRPEARLGDQFPQRTVDAGCSLTLNQTSNVGSGDKHVVVIRG